MNYITAFFISLQQQAILWSNSAAASHTLYSVALYFMLFLLVIRLVHQRNPRLGKHIRRLFIPIFPVYKRVLQQQFLYYGTLPKDRQRLFERRVQLFIDEKIFVARKMPKVTKQMKALVAGSAVQVSLGLSEVYFKHFTHIILYPDVYYSTISKLYHKGEVNPGARTIVLSWKYFLEGYQNPYNAINLGLHEMAHALHLENDIYNGQTRFLDESFLKRFEQIAEREILRIKRGENELFRSYAGENLHEFFAVSVELFFERPTALVGHLPDLFEEMVGILKQNPLAK